MTSDQSEIRARIQELKHERAHMARELRIKSKAITALQASLEPQHPIRVGDTVHIGYDVRWNSEGREVVRVTDSAVYTKTGYFVDRIVLGRIKKHNGKDFEWPSTATTSK